MGATESGLEHVLRCVGGLFGLQFRFGKRVSAGGPRFVRQRAPTSSSVCFVTSQK